MNFLENIETKTSFFIEDFKYYYFSLKKIFAHFNSNHEDFPYSTKVLIENIIRNEGVINTKTSQIKKILDSHHNKKENIDISYYPTRVLMQDFTGVPALVDLAAMRDAIISKGISPKKINPLIPVDLIIDHSVMVDTFGNSHSYEENVKMEYKRNSERYKFLKWGQSAFSNFSVVPPGTGICHQVNLEYISKTIRVKKINKKIFVFPDTLVGTDSHTTMVNALSVLGWGVGGIEAEAAMLGQPITMNFPEVVGVNFQGNLLEGVTATDLVLTVTEILRKKGVVGKFVEFFGSGIKNMTLADRATISNMAPEYGATCGFFPVDNETLNYLKLTGKTDHHIQLVRKYCKLQGLWREEGVIPKYHEIVNIDLDKVEPCLAGPKRPQDRVSLSNVPQSFSKLKSKNKIDKTENLGDGSVVIAAITSCTNTSNPSVLIAAGLIARKARKNGLKPKSWVKTSLAPGSKVVSEYLKISGLTTDLDSLGFNTVGYGCTTCIGNSGPLEKSISDKINEHNLTVCSVLSGNRNFEGRIHPEVSANYLASPPLVLIYALVGNINIDITTKPLGKDKNNNDIYLKDLWPKNSEILNVIKSCVKKQIFIKKYKDVYKGDKNWKKINTANNLTYKWNLSSTYVKHPPFFSDNKEQNSCDIIDARSLAILGDSITTDHISPAGSINHNSPAGNYLLERQISKSNFNSYGSRRGNHEIMMRGTFGNIRLKNELVPGVLGGFTKYLLDNKKLTIYDAAKRYMDEKIPLVIIAGKEYGTGSSRDWAAKGTKLLGVKAVIAESFERIHRSNLVGMGIIPLEFTSNQNRKTLNLTGEESFTINNVNKFKPKQIVKCLIKKNNSTRILNLLCRIDTMQELKYFKAGGILQYVLNDIINKSN